MNEDRASVLHRAAWLRAALQSEGFEAAGTASQIVPVVLGHNDATLDAAEHLQREGFAVRGIRPPTVPEGGSRLRLSLTTRISEDRKSTRLNSSHTVISYAVFCLKKKKTPKAIREQV